MSLLLSPIAERLLALERLLRGPGIPAGGQPSPATFKRDLRLLRDEMDAVITFDHCERKYVLRNKDWPGVWPHIFEQAFAASWLR